MKAKESEGEGEEDLAPELLRPPNEQEQDEERKAGERLVDLVAEDITHLRNGGAGFGESRCRERTGRRDSQAALGNLSTNS